MKNLRSFFLMGCLNQKTTITFSGPVEFPSVVLPAGTYVFTPLDCNNDQNSMVQVLSEDEKEVCATLLSMPAYNVTRAIKEWFGDGKNGYALGNLLEERKIV